MTAATRRTAAVLLVLISVVAAGCANDGAESAADTEAGTTSAATVTDDTDDTDDTDAADEAASVTTAQPTTSEAAPTTAAPTTAPTTTTAPDPFTILVTNDDGVSAPGIDALVEALLELPGAEVVVYAPSTNQSGTSDTTSPALPTSAEATTASGHPAVAVDGTPADSILVAIQRDGLQPDVVVSGVNTGQNIGTFVPLSGTVGAARTAARLGVPAIAVSAGSLENSDDDSAAAIARDQVAEMLDDLGFGENSDATVVNLNSPTCPAGQQVRGVLDVPVATVFPAGTNGLDLVFDCASTATTATDDATALTIGFASRSLVPADL